MPASAWSSFDLGHNLRQVLRSPVTWSLLVVLLLIQTVMAYSCGPDASMKIYQGFGLSRGGVMSGKLWQFLSCAFLHGNWAHLAMNAVLLLIVGSKIEHIAGGMTLLKVFLLGVLGSDLLHLALSDHVLIGASGAVLALLFYFTTLSPESRFLVPFRVSAKNLARGLLLASLVLILIDPNVALPGLSALGSGLSRMGMDGLFRISHPAHLGGALVGWFYARWVLRPRVTLDALRRDRAKREGQ